jgi:hypothetical protein
MYFDEYYSELVNKEETVKKYLEKAEIVIVIGTSLQTGLARNIV